MLLDILHQQKTLIETLAEEFELIPEHELNAHIREDVLAEAVEL